MIQWKQSGSPDSELDLDKDAIKSALFTAIKQKHGAFGNGLLKLGFTGKFLT